MVDRRDFYWEDIENSIPRSFLPSLLKQLYLDAAYLPRYIHVPMRFRRPRIARRSPERERAGHRVEILNPQRGQKHAFLELVEKNAQAFVRAALSRAEAELAGHRRSARSRAGLPEPPKRIECFDISHIQGSDTVASMVVWEDGRMKKSDYRKFIIRGQAMPEGPEKAAGFCATILPACAKRSSGATVACYEENKPLPSLILIDGGIGQLHAAAKALEKLADHQPALASIAKKEEILVRARARGRADRARSPFAGAALDPADSRRDAPVRGHLSSPASDPAHGCGHR